MKEQIKRLNKTQGTEVQPGVIQSGVTQTSNMPFVQQQKTKGQRLAETFGMLVDSGSKLAAKGVELYKGQKDEEAINQFNADKYRFLEELNGLNSDADRVMWVQNKSKELSDAGVNERYRNAFLNSFDGMYSKFLAGAKEEGYKVQEGLLLNDFSVGILEGRSYDEITAKYHNVLPKERYHKLYAGALLSNASLDAQSNTIRTPEDLKAFKDKYKGLIAEYNANPYLGGSKAATAVDIKTKLIDGIDKIGKSFDAQFKEQYQIQKATIERDLSMTPAAFEKFLANSYQDPSEAIKAATDYTKEYNEQQQLFTYKNNFRFNNPTNNTNWEMLSEKEKTITKDLVATSISYNLTQGTYKDLVGTVVNNIKASDSIIKSFFNTNTTDINMTKKQLTAYKGLKNTRNGNMVLYNLSKNDRTTLEILSVYPETDVQSIRDILDSDLKTANQFGDRNEYAKDWNKITAKLSPKDEKTADALRLYIFNTTGDAKASIDFVEDNFLETVSKKIGGNRILGRVTEEQAEADMVDINLVYEGYDYDTIHYDDDGSIVVSNSETSFIKSRITREDLNKASASIRTQQQLNASQEKAINIEEVKQEVKAFTNSMANRYYEGGGMFDEGDALYKPEKQQQAAEQWQEFKDMIDTGIDNVFDFFSPTKAQGASLPTYTIDNVLDSLYKREAPANAVEGQLHQGQEGGNAPTTNYGVRIDKYPKKANETDREHAQRIYKDYFEKDIKKLNVKGVPPEALALMAWNTGASSASMKRLKGLDFSTAAGLKSAFTKINGAIGTKNNTVWSRGLLNARAADWNNIATLVDKNKVIVSYRLSKKGKTTYIKYNYKDGTNRTLLTTKPLDDANKNTTKYNVDILIK